MKRRRALPLLLGAALLWATGCAQTLDVSSIGPVTSMVPVVVDGQTTGLEMRVYKPAGAGRVPTLIFNHGSTGTGRDPSRFTQAIDYPGLAQFFVQRGWAVVIPARRGRAGSEGLYDEGVALDRALGYTCHTARSLAGADRALRDIAAAMDTILAMPFVDRDRVIVGGQSRGGILSVAYAGQRPQQIKGVINFVGGWLGTGCSTASPINQALFAGGGRYAGETLWLYGDGDRYYPLSHSRENFAAFQAAGGRGTFHAIPAPRTDGHRIVDDPDLWASVVDAYLKHLGLPTRVATQPGPTPARSGIAELDGTWRAVAMSDTDRRWWSTLSISSGRFEGTISCDPFPNLGVSGPIDGSHAVYFLINPGRQDVPRMGAYVARGTFPVLEVLSQGGRCGNATLKFAR